MEKTCTYCKQSKPLECFGVVRDRAKPRYRSRCKQCLADLANRRYHVERELGSEKYERYTAQQKAARKADPDRTREESRRANRKRRELTREDPFLRLQERARDAVKHAVRTGKLERPSNCSKCGRAGRIEGHHPNYYKPLEVVWLCSTCHKALHAWDVGLRELRKQHGF